MARSWLLKPILQREPPALPEGDAQVGQRGRPSRRDPLRGERKACFTRGDGQTWVRPITYPLGLPCDLGVLILAGDREMNVIAMRLGPGKHLKGRTLLGGVVAPEDFDYFHEVSCLFPTFDCPLVHVTSSSSSMPS